MDDETKKLLLENTEITRKTLEIAQKIERRLFWQRILKTAKWTVVIIFIAIGLWQIQPYVDILLASFQNLGGTLDKFQNIIQNLPR